MSSISTLRRSAVGFAGALVLAGSGLALGATAAHAAPVDVDDSSFSWRVNDESGGGAFFGGCNFLVAGAAGDNGMSAVWTADFAAANYKTAAGDVTVTKPDGDGQQVQPTWADKCKNAAGTNVSTAVGSTSGNQVNFTGGTGSIDEAADSGTLSWDGDFTIVYYGGMTYWTISDPVLTVENGEGTLTGTASGYGADMFDPSKWVELPETEIELATFSSADLSADGLTITPDYAGVEVEGDDSGTFNPQNRDKDGWGSFPQSWVDFNLLTGQSAYWYTSGGQVDAKKTAADIVVGFDAEPAETPDPTEPEGTEEGDVEVGVEVPEGEGSTDPDPTDPDPTDPDPTDPEDPEFSVTISSTSASLGTAEQNAAGFAASGTLPTITVKDTHTTDNGFTISAQASDFSGTAGSFDAAALGWTPAATGTIADAKAGGAVAVNAPGLASAQTLVTAPDGHAAGTLDATAGLQLQAPKDAEPGAYTSTLTITTIR
jgi:hypothetical protein